MSELLNRLVTCDPEHFSHLHPLEWRHRARTIVCRHIGGPEDWEFDPDESTDPPNQWWQIAGWCLEQMQSRWGDVPKSVYMELRDVTPEEIIENYCEWKESVQE